MQPADCLYPSRQLLLKECQQAAFQAPVDFEVEVVFAFLFTASQKARRSSFLNQGRRGIEDPLFQPYRGFHFPLHD
jgi:hypothetical protein